MSAATSPSALDASLVNRAAPPGSLRYFALLYTPEDRRDILKALFVIEAEIRESALGASHDVAHTRLRWWRDEVDRLVNGAAQHPATRVLGQHHRGPRAALTHLHELLAAADMDLARMTYENVRELRAYCARSGGALAELMAIELAPEGALDESGRRAATALGIGIRQAEIVRDLRQDAHDGRIYVPLQELDKHSLSAEHLNEPELGREARAALGQLKQTADAELASTFASDGIHEALRPLRVLAALHRRLLDRIAARNYDVGRERIDLGPIEKPWVAWREARRRR